MTLSPEGHKIDQPGGAAAPPDPPAGLRSLSPAISMFPSFGLTLPWTRAAGTFFQMFTFVCYVDAFWINRNFEK